MSGAYPDHPSTAPQLDPALLVTVGGTSGVESHMRNGRNTAKKEKQERVIVNKLVILN